MAALSGLLLLIGAGLAAAVQVSEPLETVTLPLPTGGTPFNSTVPACGTVPPFVVIGAPNASFNPGIHPIYLPPQASAIATSFTQNFIGWNATEIIIATPGPGTCGPLSLPITNSHSRVLPTPSPSPSANGSSDPSPPYTNTSSHCSVFICAEGRLSTSAQHITLFLRDLTLATQRLDIAALELSSSSNSGPSRNSRRAELEPRYTGILEALIIPLEDIVATISFNLHFLSAHSALPHGCDTDSIVSAARKFIDAQKALAQILLGRTGSSLSGAGSRRRDVGRDAQHDRPGRDLPSDDDGSKENFHVPFLGSLVQGALKMAKKGVDALVIDLIGILPVRAECLRREGEALDDVLDEAIAAFD